MRDHLWQSGLRLRCMDIIGYIGEYRVHIARGDVDAAEFILKAIREALDDMQASVGTREKASEVEKAA